ncbi:hypothetical protein [Streptomyces sp. NPDC051218]|uniref:hypothetical protein n=1 Tax=Streptomyces sp. NPDC051218 TaxID=3365645 RepID=UPI003790D717
MTQKTATPMVKRAKSPGRSASLGVLALTLTTSIVLGSAPADAAPPPRTSKTCDYGWANCKLTRTHPHRGTVTVSLNNNGGQSVTLGWDVRHRGRILCAGEIKEKWGPKKFKCKNMPKGKLTLVVPYRKSSKISMKW